MTKERATCCKIPNCQKLGSKKKNGTIVYSQGFCIAHYKKSRVYGDPLFVYDYKKATKCKIDGCNGKGNMINGVEYFNKEYCTKHFGRLKFNGDPLIVKRVQDEDRQNNISYSSYVSMKKRCYDETYKNYKNWGGRGINVCEEWLGIYGFTQFNKDMGERPSKKYSIDRIDNNKGYYKENCRWVTRHSQNGNQRTNNKNVGVNWNKSGKKWRAYLNLNNKQINLGSFHDYDEACAARRAAEIKYDVYDELKNLNNKPDVSFTNISDSKAIEVIWHKPLAISWASDWIKVD